MDPMHPLIQDRFCQLHCADGVETQETLRGYRIRRFRRALGVSIWLLLLLAQLVPAQQDGCLKSLQSGASAQSQAFDERFDVNPSGQQFSCDVMIRASQAQAALDSFRLGVLFDTRHDIESVVRFPLDVSVYEDQANRTETRVNNFDEWAVWKAQHFTAFHIAAAACANAKTVRIYKNQGFAIGDGLVWFNRSIEDETVKVIRVNLYPLSGNDLLHECVERLGSPSHVVPVDR